MYRTMVLACLPITDCGKRIWHCLSQSFHRSIF